MTPVHGSSSEPVFRILHATDLAPTSEIAFVHAVKLALTAHAELDVLHVSPRSDPPDRVEFPGIGDTLRRWGLRVEKDGAGPGRGEGLRVGKIVAIDRDPVHAAVEYVQEHPTELVVLATAQRQGLDRWFYKATAEPLARESGAMTLFLPRRARGFVAAESGRVTLDRILVPVDHSPGPQAAVDAAHALLAGLGCSGALGRLLYVGEPGPMPDVRPSVPPPSSWDWVVKPGDPVDEIVAIADSWAADLLVMTTQGHAGIADALRGSTTERVLRRVACPVLAVPAGSRAMRRLFSAASPG